MKRSTDFYKVVNAVIATINMPNGKVPYFKCCRDGGKGCFTHNDDNDAVRKELFSYRVADDSENLKLAALGDDANGKDIWTLFCGNDFIQLAIEPDAYVNDNDKLCEMISNEYDLERAEITEGLNGYPRHLRGCVLVNDNKRSFEELEAIAENFGVELVEVKQKAGWQSIWEKRGTAWDLFDYENLLCSHNENILVFRDFATYAADIEELAKELREGGGAEQAEKLEEHAQNVRGLSLDDGCFIWVYCDDMTDYEIDRCKTDHFEHDSSYYSLAFDCSVYRV